MACEGGTQATTASSSTEVEFVAAFTAAKAAQCPRFILQEHGFPQEGPTETHTDDQSALQAINDNQVPAVGTHHLGARFLSSLDWREEGSISMVHVAGVPNLSDDLTKPLTHCLHARHCRRMTGNFG